MKSLLGPDVYNDIEFFQSYDNNKEHTILHIIHQYSPNESSKEVVNEILNTPVYDISLLEKRQLIIKNIIKTRSMDETFYNKAFSNILSFEKDMSWYLQDPVDDEEKELLDNLQSVYFKFFIFDKIGFNDSDNILFFKNVYNILLYPLCMILSPFMYVLLPYLVLTRKMGIKLDVKSYLRILFGSFWSVLQNSSGNISKIQLITYIISFILYLQGLYTTLNLSVSTFKTCKFIQLKMQNIIQYLENCQILAKKLFNASPNKYIESIVNQAKTYNIGTFLRLYKSLNKDYLKGFLRDVNTHFAFYTFAILQQHYNMCFTKYDETSNFQISGHDTYHIAIKNSVKNDIHIENKGVLITGPNAAGKSTLIKSLIINVILSQTIGLATASDFCITPFHFINSQINIPDMKGHASLFEAEMLRCKYNLNILKTLGNKPSLVVLDEVFSSTNIIEGISGAYAILSKLSSYVNNCTIVTTHLLYLTKLKNFKKIKMISEESKEGKIVFPFKLQYGISKQYIALELLKDSFDEDIIKTALDIKNKLLV
jgi:hypothetical protein